MIFASFFEPTWKITAILEHNDLIDCDEIQEFDEEFSCLLPNGSIKYKVGTIIIADQISWPAPNARVVYKRRVRLFENAHLATPVKDLTIALEFYTFVCQSINSSLNATFIIQLSISVMRIVIGFFKFRSAFPEAGVFLPKRR